MQIFSRIFCSSRFPWIAFSHLASRKKGISVFFSAFLLLQSGKSWAFFHIWRQTFPLILFFLILNSFCTILIRNLVFKVFCFKWGRRDLNPDGEVPNLESYQVRSRPLGKKGSWNVYKLFLLICNVLMIISFLFSLFQVSSLLL